MATEEKVSPEASQNSDGPNPSSKSTAKREAKRLEKEAKLAAKASKKVATTPKAKDGAAKKDKVKEKEEFVNTMPKREKKNLLGPMPAGYNPLAVKTAWYDWWLESGFFKPQFNKDAQGNLTIKPVGLFVIPAPLPNVTRSLYIGHALMTAIQDALIQWNCMLGKMTLFTPGFDHAGILTQSIVEKRLYKTEGKTWHDLSHEKFLEQVMAWKNKHVLPFGIFFKCLTRSLGDMAIAVHPNDERYRHLHGKFAMHPFIPGRKILIIMDEIVVDMEFGTGAVKIMPAHDPNDYGVGVRHGLEFMNILNDDGTLNANVGEMFKGMKQFHVHVAVVKTLKELGLYVDTKDNPMQILWVNCKPLAKEAIKQMEAGELLITPKQSENEWYWWLEGIQDWYISHQLCPAYFVCIEEKDQDVTFILINDGKNWVVGRTLKQVTECAKALANSALFTLEQDKDMLDTWFSSGLWPFLIMGWPDKTGDLVQFYPSSILETGWDILFFWVTHMVLLGIHLTSQMPFKEVYCHAMICDAHGHKMSKSLGNVIDPINVIQGLPLEFLHQKLYEGNLDEREIVKAKKGQKKDFLKGIPQCGTDMLRFALCVYLGGGRDINLEILQVEGYRKFCNKIFNVTKFAMLKLDEAFPTGKKLLVEKWILHKLNITAKEMNQHLTD
ncbi:Valine--tRNA ligase [Leucoagaricus sp. SymC.cos]|nr:Valine--tRNA ligase [Leucoagaricus sp. SymC.cos]